MMPVGCVEGAEATVDAITTWCVRRANRRRAQQIVSRKREIPNQAWMSSRLPLMRFWVSMVRRLARNA